MAAMKLIVCVAFLAASLKDVRAVSKEEIVGIYEKILPHITECSKEFGLAEGALKDAKEKENTESIDPCFFTCVLKKSSMMTADGKFDSATALEKTKEYLKGEEDIKSAEKAIKECESVNSEDVDDCGRGKALVECLMKHKSDFMVSA